MDVCTLPPSGLTPGEMLRQRTTPPVTWDSPSWKIFSDLYSELLQSISGDLEVSFVSTPSLPVSGLSAWHRAAQRIDLPASVLTDAGVTPDTITGDPDHAAALSRLHGLSLHELAHQLHTRWSLTLPVDQADLMRVVNALEDVRVEGRLVRERPASRSFLRLGALERVASLPTPTSAMDALVLLVSSMGRCLLGVLDVADVAMVVSALEASPIGPVVPLVADELLLLKVVADEDGSQVREVAQRILDLVSSPPTSEDEAADSSDGSDSGDSSEGSSAGESSTDSDGADSGDGGEEPGGEPGEGGSEGGDSSESGASGEGQASEGSAGSTEPRDGQAQDGPAGDAEATNGPSESSSTGDESSSGEAGESAEEGTNADGSEGDEDSKSSSEPAKAARSRSTGSGPRSTSGATGSSEATTYDSPETVSAQESVGEAKERLLSSMGDNPAAAQAFSAISDEVAERSGTSRAKEEKRTKGDVDQDEQSDQTVEGAAAAPWSSRSSGSTLRVKERGVTSEDRQARRRLTERLRSAQWRERQVTRSRSSLPPGRLHSREALRGVAESSTRPMTSAQPWKTTRHATGTQVRPKMALLVDVSGSMSHVTGAASSMLWATTSAVTDVGGSMLALAFGDDVKVLHDRSYKAPNAPLTFNARASTEAISDAIVMADARMDLSTPSSAPRLLVIVSDGAWVDPAQRLAADKHLKRLMASGCRVLLVGVGHARWCSYCGDQTCELSDSYPADSASDLDHPAHAKVVLSSAKEIGSVVGEALLVALKQ